MVISWADRSTECRTPRFEVLDTLDFFFAFDLTRGGQPFAHASSQLQTLNSRCVVSLPVTAYPYIAQGRIGNRTAVGIIESWKTISNRYFDSCCPDCNLTQFAPQENHKNVEAYKIFVPVSKKKKLTPDNRLSVLILFVPIEQRRIQKLSPNVVAW